MKLADRTQLAAWKSNETPPHSVLSVRRRTWYAAFGRITDEQNLANPTAQPADHIFGFTGRECDDESDLNFYRARYYDPATGQFISEDPIGFDAGDTNTRRYVGNSPTNATDPSGLIDVEYVRGHDIGGRYEQDWGRLGYRVREGYAQEPRTAFNKGLISMSQYQAYESGLSRFTQIPYTELIRAHGNIDFTELEFRKRSRDGGNSIREANEREAVVIDRDLSNTGSLWIDIPHDALQGTRAYVLRTGGAILAGMVDLPGQGDGLADAYAEYGEVKEQHGYLVANSNFCGLLAPCEASYNVDIMTYQPIGDDRERTYHASNGFMQFSGTCLSVAGGIKATTNFARNSGLARSRMGVDARDASVLGQPGPGVTSQHLKSLQALADETGATIVVHGSRQTGISVHTGRAFRATSDLDMGVVGSGDDLMRSLDGPWDKIPNVDHPPMRIFDSIEEALEQGCTIIRPQG